MDASNMNDLVCCLCQFLAMGHDNHTFLFLVCNVLQQVNHIPSGGFVQIARWFICQQDLGITGQGTGDGYPLLLTTGKLQDATFPVFLSNSHAAEQRFGIALAAQLYIFQRSKINNSGIPQHEIEHIARCILPDSLAYYESEEGQREFREWLAQREAGQTEGKAGKSK